MSRLAAIALPLLVAGPLAFAEGEAEGTIDEQLASLDEALMLLETDVRILEEDLLYPASSRVSVFLEMDVGELFALDAVTLELNGKEVAHSLYTDRQVDALYRGGVQQLFTGNLKQGENELNAFFVGRGPHGRDYRRAATVTFEHEFEPVVVQLAVTDDTTSRQPEFTASVR